MSLPIHTIRDKLLSALNSHQRLCLSAPTGSGKSTQIPQFLLDTAPGQGRVIVLQPRRLAARMLAERVATERHGRTGQEVGYRTRFESAVSRTTRLVFMTQGILPRMLQDKPTLPGIDAVVLDEFHERQVDGDLSLALLKQLQQTDRPDIRLVVMSATLDCGPLRDYLAPCPHIELQTRLHPVEISHQTAPVKTPIWEHAGTALATLLNEGATGDILIFMPGAYEIRRCIDACRQRKFGEPLTLLPLYGGLPANQQNAAMQPAPNRKVVVATNIAETSLTITGVRHVIDSGQARINRYDPGRGLNTLFVEATSRASADQRAGRAGREAPGRCIRLWSKSSHGNRCQSHPPEIERVDVAEVLLYLQQTGLGNDHHFTWLSEPLTTSVDAAIRVLRSLGAFDVNAQVTPLGREIAHVPVHPRLARLLLEASRYGCTRLAAQCAALLSERPITLPGPQAAATRQRRFSNTMSRSDDAIQSDIFLLIHALNYAESVDFSASHCQNAGIHGSSARQVARTAQFFGRCCERQGWDTDDDENNGDALIKCLIVSFPDHLARRRDSGSLRCHLAGGRSAELERTGNTRQSPLLIAGEIREIGRGDGQSRIVLTMVSDVREDWLKTILPNEWSETEQLVWNDNDQAVEKRLLTTCANVVMHDVRSRDVDRVAAGNMLAAEILRRDLPLKGWDKECREWISRVQWLSAIFPERELIAYDDDDRQIIVAELTAGERRYNAVRTQPCLPYVKNVMSWSDQQFVETMAPARLMLPTGRRMRIRYRLGHPPRGNARIQDLYDLLETPTVAGGRARLLVEILGPNMRPIQVTDDLSGFWANLYPEVKPQLARRYPKHEWR